MSVTVLNIPRKHTVNAVKYSDPLFFPISYTIHERNPKCFHNKLKNNTNNYASMKRIFSELISKNA